MVVCVLETQLVESQLALVLQNGSSSSQPDAAAAAGACDLGVEGNVIGVLVKSGAGLGLGVVSAVIAGSGNVSRGWTISLITTVVRHQFNPTFQEWTFQNASCWFELQEELGFDEVSPSLINLAIAILSKLIYLVFISKLITQVFSFVCVCV